jgi:PAS domain S-box-containing protein
LWVWICGPKKRKKKQSESPSAQDTHMAGAKTKQQLTIENEELRARLQELEDTLEAIRSGAVDAIVASGPAGDRVYTLEGADHAYHTMVESMNEGAVTILTDGIILYGNRQFGQMTGAPPSAIVGRPFHDFVPVSDHPTWNGFIQQAGSNGLKAEMRLRNGSAAELSVQISATPIDLGGTKALALVVTDLSERRRYEEIVAAERLARYILEQSLEGVAVCINGRILFASRRLHEICGRNPLLQPFDKLFPLRMPGSETFSVEIPQSGQVVKSAEVGYQNPDGKSYSLILNAGPLYGDDHQILGSLVSLTDVSELTHTQEALRESEDRYRRLVDTAPDAIIVHRDGRFLFANEAALRLYGADDFEQLKSRNIVELLHPDDREIALTRIGQVQAGGRTPLRESRLLTLNGQEVTIEATAAPINYGGDRAVQVIIRDITLRRQAEEALGESRQRLAVIVDSIADGFYALDRSWRFTHVNDAALRHMGKTREEILGRTLFDVYPESRCSLIETEYARAMESGEPSHFKNPSLITGRILEIHAYPGSEILTVLFRDVTEQTLLATALRESEESLRLANEHLEQRVRERTMDLQNLAGELERSRHELRNLVSELVMAEERERKRIAGVLHDEIAQTLAAARMRLDLLQGAVSDQRDAQTLQEVKAFLVQSIQETRTLMSDVGNPLLFDMGLKAACESLAERLMRRHPVRILCDIRDAFKNLDPDVKTILYQLVRELLTNVVKHSQARNAHVLIDLEDGHFRVKVSDDGVGFDPQKLGVPTVDGGFGLYSIRERLLAIDGSLGILSNPGAGTVVAATVPAAMK